MTRILSGVQPTGNLHLGNYLGAIKNWVDMQHLHESLFCIVDLHAITVPQNPASLREATLTTAAAYIACGIDPEKSVIFHQSAVPEHSELAWLFSTITPMGWLNRMTQFKDKTQQSKVGTESFINVVSELIIHIRYIQTYFEDAFHKNEIQNNLLASELANKSVDFFKQESKWNELKKATDFTGSIIKVVSDNINNTSNASLGLFSYPVLMAADILLYKATHVPVGEDQKQHLELARDIAGAFNRQYKKQTPKPYFRLPEPMILGSATRVMSLRDGTKKMSKSEESDYSRINLTDSADLISQKIKKAKSDMELGISYDVEKRPEVSNMINIFVAVTGQSRDDIVKTYENSGMAAFKSAFTEAVIEHLAPITKKLNEIKDDRVYLEGLLKHGAGKARNIASGNIKEIKNIMGFLEG